ncbi:MAG: hypothetical protein K2W96_24690 [Gemmataceae bacterium]|nr:hypothetical protein [Gemmataceae bacterium]
MSAPSVEPLEPDAKLSRANLHLVADFTCTRPGDPEPPWEQDIREWITARPRQGGAIDAVEARGDSIWLYLDETGAVLGFVSLGLGTRTPKDATPVQLLPYLGMHTRGRGGGRGCRAFEWAIREAERRHREDGLPSELVLYVDPNNPAVALYEGRGFTRIAVDEDDPRKWVIMALRFA